LIGRYALWVVFDTHSQQPVGFFATEVVQYPQCKLLCIQHCVIDPHYMASVEPRMEELATDFAKNSGCVGIEFVGRPGWRKYSKENGYASHSVVYQKFFEAAQEKKS